MVLFSHLNKLIFYQYFCQQYNAKLSDFGLAKDGPEGDKTHVSTRVMGTYGYAAPEYVMTGKIKLTCYFGTGISLVICFLHKWLMLSPC